MKRFLPLVLLLVAHVTPSLAGGDSEQSMKLLEMAEAKANIFELPSFRLKASVTIDSQGKPIDGSYMLLWNGPDQWREEVNLPGYSEVKVGRKGLIATKRSTELIPLRIEQIHQTLGYGHAHLLPGPTGGVKRVRERTVNGVKLECVEVLEKENYSKQVCVDPSTDAWVRQGFFVDKELVPIGTKFFPRSMRYVDNSKTLVQADVTELTTPADFPGSAFEVPSGAVSKPGCMNPSSGRLVKRVNPLYPEADRRQRIEGTVALYALIATDGTLRDVRVVAGASPGLNQASLDAVRQWRYAPYTCDGTAMEVETVLTVNFSLRY